MAKLPLHLAKSHSTSTMYTGPKQDYIAACGADAYTRYAYYLSTLAPAYLVIS